MDGACSQDVSAGSVLIRRAGDWPWSGGNKSVVLAWIKMTPATPATDCISAFSGLLIGHAMILVLSKGLRIANTCSLNPAALVTPTVSEH